MDFMVGKDWPAHETDSLGYKGAPAITLSPDDLGKNKSGWTITGEIHEDYFEWVNYFEATHPTYGKIKGNFEDKIEAKNKEALEHFISNHRPEYWDYYDI